MGRKGRKSSDESGGARRPSRGRQHQFADPTGPLAVSLSPERLRGLLIVLTRTPADAVAQVGQLLMLFEAIVRTNLPTAPSRHPVCMMIAKQRQQDMALIASAKKEKSRENGGTRKLKDNQEAVKGSGGDDGKHAKALQSWAVKRYRNASLTLELLRSGASAIRQMDERLLSCYTKAMSMDRVARVSSRYSEKGVIFESGLVVVGLANWCT